METVEANMTCDDCISRQAVNDLVDELARAISDERCHMPRGRATGAIMWDIINLPPVTPKKKSEYEHDHEVVKAYNDGQAYILDKIRAEIENDWQFKNFPRSPWSCGLRRAIEIIDKYRGE